jgi:FMN phosphatase YigB (HAD superfamily)
MISLKNILSEVRGDSYIIYCDMDGVLVDFERGFMDISKGVNPDSLPRARFWAMFYSLTKGKEREYWANLPWMRDGKELWSYIKKLKPEILTAPPSESAEKGKIDWCKNNLGSVKVNFKQARDKHHFAKKNAILIDDKESTIDKWNSVGGTGIYHTSAANTITELKKLGL